MAVLLFDKNYLARNVPEESAADFRQYTTTMARKGTHEMREVWDRKFLGKNKQESLGLFSEGGHHTVRSDSPVKTTEEVGQPATMAVSLNLNC
jgi:hypothetical protein